MNTRDLTDRLKSALVEIDDCVSRLEDFGVKVERKHVDHIDLTVTVKGHWNRTIVYWGGFGAFDKMVESALHEKVLEAERLLHKMQIRLRAEEVKYGTALAASLSAKLRAGEVVSGSAVRACGRFVGGVAALLAACGAERVQSTDAYVVRKAAS